MDYQIKGKYAFINAGAHGIGEATADLLTQEGAQVIVADRDEAALKEKAHRWTGVVAADLATAEGAEHAISYVLSNLAERPISWSTILAWGTPQCSKSCLMSAGPRVSRST